MKRILLAAALVSIGATSWAQSDKSAAATLRTECAAKNTVKMAAPAKAKAENEYNFVYYKGELRGEYTAGQALGCSESQFAAYLDKADPSLVMSAYPTAAGRPTGKAPAPK